MSNQREVVVSVMKRDFPMLVTPDDERRIRKAAHAIESRLEDYRSRFGIGDDMYLTLMATLDIAAEWMATQEEQAELAAQLAQIQQVLDTAVSHS